VYPQLVRREATASSCEDVWGECEVKHHQSILNDFWREPKVCSNSIKRWLEIVSDSVFHINTNNQVLNLYPPYLVVVGSSKFCYALGFNQSSSFEIGEHRITIGSSSSRDRHF
jgi:hypothetical protein